MKKYQEMTKKQLVDLPSKPEFMKTSMRVLEGYGFDNYLSPLNIATIVISKEEKADHIFNGILGYAIDTRIREVVGATHKDMQAALVADMYIVNNETETFVKCTGKELAEILKEAVKRGAEANLPLKEQAGLANIKELTLRPMSDYDVASKFQRYLSDMKIKRDQEGIDIVNELLKIKSFSIKKLFEFSKQIAIARFHNLPREIIDAFEHTDALKKFKKSTYGSDGFF